eukprot:gene6585-biopygen4186
MRDGDVTHKERSSAYAAQSALGRHDGGEDRGNGRAAQRPVVRKLQFMDRRSEQAVAGRLPGAGQYVDGTGWNGSRRSGALVYPVNHPSPWPRGRGPEWTLWAAHWYDTGEDMRPFAHTVAVRSVRYWRIPSQRYDGTRRRRRDHSTI